MSTRSIFQKTCPSCMATLASDTRECACGHDFSHDDPAGAPLSSEEIRLKAEELYESYLAARAEQAASAMKTARAEFARDPADPQRSERLAAATHDSQAAKTALEAQSARVAEMRKALPPAAPAHAPRPAPAALVAKKKIVAAKPLPEPQPLRKAIHAGVNPVKTASLRHKRPPKATIPIPTATEARPAPLSVAAKPRTIATVQTKTPNPAFRKAQAIKAEKILRAAKQSAPAIEVKQEETKAVMKREPEPSAPPLTLSKSAPRLLASDKKECPNCTASVESRLNRCRCGYEFPSSETLIPSLAMSEEERAEFAKLFSFPS